MPGEVRPRGPQGQPGSDAHEPIGFSRKEPGQTHRQERMPRLDRFSGSKENLSNRCLRAWSPVLPVLGV